MATPVEELLNMLFDMVDEARNAPLSSEKCIIERDKALDLIEDVKAQLPVELAEARKVLNNRNELLSGAKREAEELQKRAENEARRLISETEITAAARKNAAEMTAQAEQKSKEIRMAANKYCDDVMRRAEEALGEAHTEMRRVQAKFREALGMSSGSTSANRAYDAEADQ
ncbi:hypothetical protein H9X86_01940 [Pseudoflavonifractor capillosus]|uniref:hypothetical protein n=1 Tax=Pseudoflavonifractor capillosus TaxID=106588 RepID=UPI0019566520|nr:hypothetical protein [Pseudoflavonifractor capillosus]MBM6896134.1 hypothetical protein [Pseudoflavonifractor capillosus]